MKLTEIINPKGELHRMHRSFNVVAMAYFLLFAGLASAGTVSAYLNFEPNLPGNPTQFQVTYRTACAFAPDGTETCDTGNPSSAIAAFLPGLTGAVLDGPEMLSNSEVFNAYTFASMATPSLGIGGAVGVYEIEYVPTSSISQFEMLPSVSINSTANAVGKAQVYQDIGDGIGYSNFSELNLSIYITGSQFTLDPTTSTMTLISGPGGGGQLYVEADSWRNGSFTSETLLNYSYGALSATDSPIVYQSDNLLGLPLPSVGQGASFSVEVDPFVYSFSALAPSAGQYQVYTGIVDSVNIMPETAVPEAPTFWLVLPVSVFLILGLLFASCSPRSTRSTFSTRYPAGA